MFRLSDMTLKMYLKAACDPKIFSENQQLHVHPGGFSSHTLEENRPMAD
jgi:hypothetical protein